MLPELSSSSTVPMRCDRHLLLLRVTPGTLLRRDKQSCINR